MGADRADKGNAGLRWVVGWGLLCVAALATLNALAVRTTFPSSSHLAYQDQLSALREQLARNLTLETELRASLSQLHADSEDLPSALQHAVHTLHNQTNQLRAANDKLLGLQRDHDLLATDHSASAQLLSRTLARARALEQHNTAMEAKAGQAQRTNARLELEVVGLAHELEMVRGSLRNAEARAQAGARENASPRGRFAFVTLATSHKYGLGSIALMESLRFVNTTAELVVMVGGDLDARVREILQSLGVRMVEVADISLPQGVRATLQRKDWEKAFSKLHIWRLTEYDAVVWMDTDCVVLQNVDALFAMPALSGRMDCCGPNLNSGVLVVHPSQRVYDDMLRTLGDASMVEPGKFENGDQALISLYFLTGADPEQHAHLLPREYNFFVFEAKCETRDKAWGWREADVRVVHFANHFLDFETLVVEPNAYSRDYPCAGPFYRWWNKMFYRAVERSTVPLLQ